MKTKCPVCSNPITITKQEEISPIRVWGGEILQYKVEWQCVNFPQRCNCNGCSLVSKKELDISRKCDTIMPRGENND